MIATLMQTVLTPGPFSGAGVNLDLLAMVTTVRVSKRAILYR